MRVNIAGCDTLNGNLPTILSLCKTSISMLFPQMKNTSKRLFFRHDGHWNADGNSTFAESLII